MSAPRHLVRRQRYELAAADARKAAGLQERMRVAHERHVVPAIDALLTSLASGDDVYLFDRVELDLGTVTATAIEEEIGERVVERLGEVVRAGLAGARHRADTGPREIDADRVSLELLRRFLRSGVLPWWAPVGARASLDERFAEALDGAPEALVEMLRSVGHPALARRIVKQFAASEVSRTISLLAGPSAGEWREAVDDWVVCLDGLRGTGRWSPPARDEVIAQALDLLLSGSIDAAELSGHVLARLSRDRGQRPSECARDVDEVARGSLSPGSPILRWLAGARSRDEGFSGATGASPPTAGDTPSSNFSVREGDHREFDVDRADDDVAMGGSGRGELAPLPERRTGDPAPPSRDGSAVHAPSGDPARANTDSRTASERHGSPDGTGDRERTAERPVELAVVDPEIGALLDDAGLVLAWPFLTRFFAEVELVADEAFVSNGARERAVLLLRHVVTGETEIPECDLLLDKLLCGWPLDEPVTRRIEPTERESRSVAELLASILENWKALGSTSPDGLRASFLVREGLLQRRELGWNLKVERKSYDILLERLPWGFGVVKLPWMEEPLMVEW